MSISGVARHLGRSRNTVRAALRSSKPPRYVRREMGSRVDEFEPQIRSLLKVTPSMPTSVVMERVGWDGGRTVFYERVARIRRDYKVADPVDKLVHLPGEMMQWDLWFPGVPVGLGEGRNKRRPAVLVGVLPHSKVIRALMIPSVKAFDILAGMYAILTVLIPASRSPTEGFSTPRNRDVSKEMLVGHLLFTGSLQMASQTRCAAPTELRTNSRRSFPQEFICSMNRRP